MWKESSGQVLIPTSAQSICMLFLFEYASCTGDELPPEVAVEGRAMYLTLHRSLTRRAEVASFSASPEPPLPGLERPESWRHAFAEAAERCESALIIAPESDGILLELTKVVERSGALNLGSSASAVAVAGDKYRCYRALRGLPQPETEVFRGRCSLDLPVVAKPRWGEGGTRVVVTSEEELEQVPRGWVVQELVEGEPMSASLLVGDEVRVLSLNTQRFSGTSYAGGDVVGGEVPEEVVAAAERIKGLFGYVGVDFILGEEVSIVEVNPRVTTMVAGLERALDAELGEVLLKNATSERLPELEVRRRVGVRKLRGTCPEAVAAYGGYCIAVEVLG